MKHSLPISLLLTTLLLSVTPCHASRVKAYVNRFSVSVAENREELKGSLQTLLMSRLNSDEIQAVDKLADADIIIEGSYIVFGGVFSLDGLIKNSSGQFIDRVFIQGDSQTELIPAVSDMARALRRSLGKWDPSLAVKGEDKPATVSEKLSPVKARKEPHGNARPAVLGVPPASARQQPLEKPWESHRLPESLNGIAIGRVNGDRGVELFTSSERSLRYYLKGKMLQFVSAITVAPDERVVGVDTADLDRDGVWEIYLSVIKGGVPASQVYQVENNQLKRIAADIPYFLRGIANPGKELKIYAQKVTASGSLHGDLFEIVKRGESFATENPQKLPLFANLYNFVRFKGAKGEQNYVVGHPDGYLLVYAPDGKQLWKSRDKFGGSEEVSCSPGAGSSPSCNLARSQRLLVTAAGDIVAPRNTGMKVGGVGGSVRSSILLLSWDGHSMKEKWRSVQSQSYLADYSLDDRARELLTIEVEPVADSSGERGSRVVVRKLE